MVLGFKSKAPAFSNVHLQDAQDAQHGADPRRNLNRALYEQLLCFI